ncbi:hypothetical protein ACFL0G_03915 [Candidatus Zixiibacteriota bacterium]
MKILKGIRGLSWQDGELCTFIAALQRTLESLGEDHTYPYLMGLSGAAFRLQIHRDGLCPSGPDATCGFDSCAHILKTLRYSYRCLQTSDGEETIKSAVKESIGAGIAAIAADLIETPDWGLIVGYDDDNDYLVLTYFNDHKNKPQPAQKPPWFIYLLGEKPGSLNRDEAERKSLFLLRNLLENLSYGAYHTGQAAYQAWLDRLKNIGRFLAGLRENRGDHLIGNYWNYISLIDARKAAKKYLQEEIRFRRFDNDAIYRKMGDLFGQEAEALSEYDMKPPFQDDGKSMLQEGNVKRQMEALQQAAVFERKVLGLWERLEL